MTSTTFKRTVALDLTRGGINKEARTVSVAFSSEFPVSRGTYDEVLDHSPANVDLSRLRDNHPLLSNHDSAAHIGTVERAWVDSDKKGRATVRFSRSAKGEAAWQDVCDGILKHVSVGYQTLREVARKRLAAGRELIRFAWQPYEISLVSVPADPSCGIGRSQSTNTRIFMTDENEQNQDQDQASNRRERRAEEHRERAIRAAAESIIKDYPEGAEKFRHMATEAVLSGTPSDLFNQRLLAAIPGVRKVETYDCNIGMDARDVNRWSLSRAIASIIRDGRLSGVEAQAHQAYESKFHERAQGFWIPPDCIVGTRQQRDMTVGVASQGGNFVQTTVVTPIIELLRNRMCCLRLGAQSMTGLQGNCAIPRQTGAATAYSLPETATLTKSNQAIDQVMLSPHRVGAYNEYSKQLLLQSSVDVENFIRDDLMKVTAIKWDKLMIDGSGSASEPTGILHTSGIGSVTFGGAATLAKLVSFETALAASNADDGAMAYLTTPSTRAKLKLAPKIGSTFPVFIWEKGEWGDGARDGMVNDYRAAVTNQIASDAVFFGNWNDLVQAMWGGWDVVVNPYSRDVDAMVRITVNTFGDIAIRHSASFAVSSDSGAQ